MVPTGVAKMAVVTPDMRSDGLLNFSRGLFWAAHPIWFYSLENQPVRERQMSCDLLVRGCVSCTHSPLRSRQLPLWCADHVGISLPTGCETQPTAQNPDLLPPCRSLRAHFTAWADSFLLASPPHFCDAWGRKELSPPSLGSTPPSPCFPVAGKRQPSAVHETEFKSLLSLDEVDKARD